MFKEYHRARDMGLLVCGTNLHFNPHPLFTFQVMSYEHTDLIQPIINKPACAHS